MGAAGSIIVSGRSCDDCTLCCKLMGITALSKPRLSWCEHCEIDKGCHIYAQRPDECATFNCGYLLHDRIGAHWKPATSHMVVVLESIADRVSIYVDEAHGDAWRREPYFSDIKQWAANAARQAGQVVVWEGLEAFVIFPDREKHIGPIRDGQVLVIGSRKGPDGPFLDAVIMEPDDPRLQPKSAPAPAP